MRTLLGAVIIAGAFLMAYFSRSTLITTIGILTITAVVWLMIIEEKTKNTD